MAAPRIVVVIPALDEEEAIGSVVREVPPLVDEVIVVDNGSRDRTAAAAREAGATVVSEPRRGYGNACLAGIAAAGRADVIVFLDGDRSDYPAQLVGRRAPDPRGPGRPRDRLAQPAAGARRGRTPGTPSPGTRACVGLMNLLTGSRATDLGPFRAITADALRRLDMRDRNYGWTVEMQVKAARRGLRVVEVPVDYRPRLGRSKVSGTRPRDDRRRHEDRRDDRAICHAEGTRSAVPEADAGGPSFRGAPTLAGDEESAAPVDSRAPSAGRGPRRRRDLLLALAGLVLTACVAAWALGPPPTTRIGPHLAPRRGGVRRVPRRARGLARALAPRARSCAWARPSSGARCS